MTDQNDFGRAHAHLSAALPLLDALGLRLAAADVAMAIDRMERSPLAKAQRGDNDTVEGKITDR